MTHKVELVGHSHHGEIIPIPSNADKTVLRKIGQKKSAVISAMTAICVEYSSDDI